MNEAFVALNWRTVPALPARSPQAHKGSFGHVFAVGGGPGMGGALALACAAAYRVGAGLVTAVGHPSAIPYLAAHLPEATWRDWPASFGDLPDQAVLAVGPGLGQGLAAHDLLLEIGALSCPQVWDADALNILARFGPELLAADAVRLFTPHPGEAARLLGVTAAAVQADRAAAICRLQTRYGGHWVLKGHHSLLLGSGGHWLCPLGNPGMATGGSGDVLTGILAGLLAQDLEADKALSLGVCLHARAGDLAAAQMGEASLLAGDILAAVPHALQELTQNHDGN
ncbi:NAD(P)H-hydrate dehydratase [Acidithiobacillus sp.]|uniref:NAD(P)H-hydrate dehydratase n=1 Tax=Acidithiobacillus sp. TaxID=1872118 RepID=UPI00261EC309|nr:NAD(P)H-hydrate dehydratase [Acidithiobacillus sp.]